MAPAECKATTLDTTNELMAIPACVEYMKKQYVYISKLQGGKKGGMCAETSGVTCETGTCCGAEIIDDK